MKKYQVRRPLEVATTVEKALVILDTDGWCKGSVGNAKGECCALGAVWTAARMQGYADATLTDAVRCISSHLLPVYCWGHKRIEAYNDDKRTRKRGVRRLLQRTLRTLRKQIAADTRE